jgi:hypothetical protein
VTRWMDGPTLRADLAAFEPDVKVSHVRFGLLMRQKGHDSRVIDGAHRYSNIQIERQKPLRVVQYEPGEPRQPRNPLRQPDGSRWKDPRTGLEIPDDKVGAWLDRRAAAEAEAPVKDRGGKVIGNRVPLGMIRGKSVKGSQL